MLSTVARFIRFSSALKPLFLIPWAVTLISLSFTTDYMEQYIRCYPITVITTSKDTVNTIKNTIPSCSFAVQNEKVTIDSRLLNDNERAPVRTIYLVLTHIPFHLVSQVSTLSDTEIEENVFVKKAVGIWEKSKMKTLVLSFFLLTVFGVLSTLLTLFSAQKTAMSRKSAILIHSLEMLAIIVPSLALSRNAPFFLPAVLSSVLVFATGMLFQIVFNPIRAQNNA